MAKNEYETVVLVREVFENDQHFFEGIGKRGTTHKVAVGEGKLRRESIVSAAMGAEARDTDGFVSCVGGSVHVTGMLDTYAVVMTVETDR